MPRRHWGRLFSPHIAMVTKLLHTRYRVQDLDRTIAFLKGAKIEPASIKK